MPEGADAAIVDVKGPEGCGGKAQGDADQGSQNGLVSHNKVLAARSLQHICSKRHQAKSVSISVAPQQASKPSTSKQRNFSGICTDMHDLAKGHHLEYLRTPKVFSSNTRDFNGPGLTQPSN